MTDLRFFPSVFTSFEYVWGSWLLSAMNEWVNEWCQAQAKELYLDLLSDCVFGSHLCLDNKKVEQESYLLWGKPLWGIKEGSESARKRPKLNGSSALFPFMLWWFRRLTPGSPAVDISPWWFALRLCLAVSSKFIIIYKVPVSWPTLGLHDL